MSERVSAAVSIVSEQIGAQTKEHFPPQPMTLTFEHQPDPLTFELLSFDGCGIGFVSEHQLHICSFAK